MGMRVNGESQRKPMSAALGLLFDLFFFLVQPVQVVLFEAFGFDYIGPLDGHDMATLVDVFAEVRAASSSSTSRSKDAERSKSKPAKLRFFVKS